MPYKHELMRPDGKLIAGYSAIKHYSPMHNMKLILIHTHGCVILYAN